MEQQHTRVPALRFPEFEGDWVEKRLGEVADGIMYGMNSSAIPYDGKNKYLRITDIDESSRTFSPNPLTSPDGLIEEKYKLKEGDIVFTRTGASVGKSYLYKNEDGNLLFAGFLIKFSIVGCDPYFVFIQTLTSKYDEWVLKMSMRSGQPGLNAEEYKDFLISLPTLPEQQKIATFFTAIDEKLRGLKEKQNLLEVYKKGVMQQLFTQQIRFKKPDGGDFEDWTVRRLGEVYSFKTTNSFSRENLNYEMGSIKNIHYGDIHTKFSTLFDITKEKVPFINAEINTDRISVENYCIEGDVIFADASEDLNDVGKSIEIVNLNNERLLSGLHTLLARPESSKLSKGFGGYLFKSENIRLQIQKEAQGSKVLSISAGRLSNIQISLPTLPEQTQIATYLSALDAKIAAVSAQVSALGEWKKGLLQRMFP